MRLPFGRPKRPEPCRLRLVPVNDVAADGGGMRSTGSDPFFLLQPESGGFPAGRCEFVFEALPGTVPLQPVLYLDTGADFNEAQTIRMAGGEAGTYRQLIRLPPGLVRLRFDPTGLPGPLPLRNARLIPRPRAAVPARDYAGWVAEYDTLDDEDRRLIAQHIARLRQRVEFAIDVPPGADRQRTLASVERQLYRRWSDRGRYVLHLQPGDVLADHALYRLAAEIEAHPDAMVLTMDADMLDPATGERHSPQFGGAWSPELVRSGVLPGAVAVRRDAGELDRLPREAFRHVPGVLVHHTQPVPHPDPAPLPPAGEGGTLPLVSIIIPTRDGLEHLRRTLDGVLRRTDYPAIEVIVIDNGSVDPATLAYLADLPTDPRVRVMRDPGPFNYARLNNAAVELARGEVIALLNNDMDVIAPGWLGEMVRHALRPKVGAVGCKLLYADGSIQHAGIVTGMTGLAGHLFRHAADGSHALLAHTRDVSAVTGACLVMRRALYQEVGGLDAAELAVSYNDVDLCLRLDQAGYRIVWTPHACLYHLESVTRGKDSNPDNAQRAQREHDVLLQRWGARLLRDPFYSPCLATDREDGALAWPPRAAQPWRELDPR